MPRWTCREPALITSIGSRRASATATPVLPTPVGPAITTRRGFTCPAIDPSVRVLPAPRRASAPAARLVPRAPFQTRLAARVAEPPRPPLGSYYAPHSRLASRRASPSLRGRRSARTTRPVPDSPRGARRRASAAAARLVLPTAFQLAPDVAERHAAHDRPPVRAEVGCVRRAKLRHEPLHLLARERHIRLHRRAAGDERQRPVEGRLAGLRPRELVHRCLDEPPRLVALQERGNGADDDRAAAELLEGEAELIEGRPPALEYVPCAGPEVERRGEEQRLRGGFPRVELAAEALEDHALVGDVLVEEEDFLVGRRHDECVLDLPEDPTEERTRVGLGGVPEERGLLGDDP